MMITFLYVLISLIISNILTKLILRFHSTILFVNRNILTYLNTLLIICMDVGASIQV